MCPRSNDSVLHHWCSRDCYFDDNDGHCKEKSNLKISKIVKLILCITVSHIYLNIITFINITDEYVAVEQVRLTSCKQQPIAYDSIQDVKAVCSQDTACIGVLQVWTDLVYEQNYMICSGGYQLDSFSPTFSTQHREFPLYQKKNMFGNWIYLEL